jgi:DNA-binding LacI/PurR family transcriptional regulator
MYTITFRVTSTPHRNVHLRSSDCQAYLLNKPFSCTLNRFTNALAAFRDKPGEHRPRAMVGTMSVSIREIARLAGVSSATVSRVINGSNLVTNETTQRIQKIVRELNFVPNRSAIQLKNGKSQIYGIIIPDLTNPFFTETVKIFEELLVENENELLVANTDFHSTRMQRSVRRMLLRRVDGVALLTSEFEAAPLESLVQNRIPVVTTDHYRTAPGICDIVIDFSGGMSQLVTHLKGLGHRKIGFIGGTDGLVTSRVRKESFLHAVVKHGLSSREGWILEGNFKIDGGAAAMTAILGQSELPTAIVCANDLTAIGVLRAAHERGIRVPEDISVAGCDDIAMADIVYPPLTTLCISRKEYARLLFRALQGASQDLTKQGTRYLLPTTLVVRQSTGPAPRTPVRKPTGGPTQTAARTKSRPSVSAAKHSPARTGTKRVAPKRP